MTIPPAAPASRGRSIIPGSRSLLFALLAFVFVLLPLAPAFAQDTLEEADDAKREQVIARIRDEAAAGRQVYWVCPLVEESEKIEARAAVDRVIADAGLEMIVAIAAVKQVVAVPAADRTEAVAAGSVVTKDIPTGTIVAGCPAKKPPAKDVAAELAADVPRHVHPAVRVDPEDLLAAHGVDRDATALRCAPRTYPA